MSDVLSFKIITIGDSGVGKTSIIRRFVFNTFEQDNLSTIGVNFSFKDCTIKNGNKVKIKVIDTAGQEKYKSLSKSYFKNADGVLFVFAIDDLQSFQNIREWITLFNENNSGKEGIPKYLIANKDDLENESKVNKELIDQFLKENNNQYKFKSVSALKCDKRIEELFQEIAENLYNNYKDVKQSTIQLEKNNPNKKKMKCYLCDFNY
jgi:small GTP-binding protein